MLMDKLVQLRKETSSLPEAKLQSSQLKKSVPGTLTSTAKKVSKAEAIAAKKARFAKVMSKQADVPNKVTELDNVLFSLL